MRVAVACAVVAAFAARTAPAAAQGASEPEKIHVEARLMFWADASGRQSGPDQQETITDFFVRRARILLQGRATRDLTLSFQLGSDDIGSKVLTEECDCCETPLWMLAVGGWELTKSGAGRE
jgi:hypothetical protein